MKTSHNWPTTTLGEVFIFIGNGTTAEQNKNGMGLPVTRIETIADERINSNRVGYIENADAELVERYRIEPGDVLFSHINSEPQIGRAVVYKSHPPLLLHGMNLLRLRFNADAADSEFMVYLFRHYREKGVFISLASRAVGQSSINQGRLKNLQIQLPPLPEQRAIAHLLQIVQGAKEARKRELTLERERKGALIDHLFEHGTRVQATKQTEVGEIPESWTVKAVGDLIVKNQYGLSIRANAEGKIPILRMGNLVEGRVEVNDLQWVNISPELVRAFTLKPGDLLFNRTNSEKLVGKTAIFESDGTFVFASYLIRLECDLNLIVPQFLNAYLNRENIQTQVRALATRGVSQSNISASKLARFRVPIPPIAEQERIAEVLTACDRKIQTLKEELEHFEELFKAALHELMEGNLSAHPLVAEDTLQ